MKTSQSLALERIADQILGLGSGQTVSNRRLGYYSDSQLQRKQKRENQVDVDPSMLDLQGRLWVQRQRKARRDLKIEGEGS